MSFVMKTIDQDWLIDWEQTENSSYLKPTTNTNMMNIFVKFIYNVMNIHRKGCSNHHQKCPLDKIWPPHCSRKLRWWKSITSLNQICEWLEIVGKSFLKKFFISFSLLHPLESLIPVLTIFKLPITNHRRKTCFFDATSCLFEPSHLWSRYSCGFQTNFIGWHENNFANHKIQVLLTYPKTHKTSSPYFCKSIKVLWSIFLLDSIIDFSNPKCLSWWRLLTRYHFFVSDN